MRGKIRALVKKFFLIDDTPQKIAGGAALGIFFGITPGEGVATTLIVATLLRLNRLSATTGVLASNMWTTLAVLPLAAGVGAFVFGENYRNLINQFRSSSGDYFQLLYSKALFFNFTLPLLVGFFIVAGLIAFVFYLGILFALLRKKHLEKDAHLLLKNRN